MNLEYLRKMRTVLKLCVRKEKRLYEIEFLQRNCGEAELSKKMKIHSFYLFSSFPFLLENLLGELKLLVLVV